jgi:TolB-like protein
MPDERQQPDAPAIPAETIRPHLAEILKSPAFAGSERLRKFLRFLVDQTLQGHADQLKEYTVGVEVFERSPDYDPRIDPTVRVHAGKLRDKLREYYLTDGRDAPVRIEVGKGSYVPSFRLQTAPAPEKEVPNRGTRRKWIFAAALLVVAVTVALASRFLWRVPPAAPAVASSPQRRSLVVLPFLNLSGEAREEYFSDGLTEELTNTLASVEGLQVVARTSAFYFKGKSSDVRQIGKTLNVAAVLEGSVRKSDGKLRITAQFVNAADGYHLWSHTYETDEKDIFAVQEEIAQAIAGALKIQLKPGQERIVFRRPTENLEAYKRYLTGRFYWNKHNPGDLRTAIEYYQQAIAADPKFAAAWAGLANTYFYYFIYADDAASVGKARAAAEKALAIDPASAEALSVLGVIKGSYDFNWPEAERLFRRALEANPNDAEAHHQYGMVYLSPFGRLEEALAEEERALELDPVSFNINEALADVYYFLRQYDKAIAQFEKVIQLDPNFAEAYLYLGYTYAERSLFAEAISTLDRQPMQLWAAGNLGARGYVYARWGKPEETYKLLEEWKSASKPMTETMRVNNAAWLYLSLKDYDRMFEWLDKGVQGRYRWIIFLKVRPAFDPIHSDPRYHALLRKMRIPE